MGLVNSDVQACDLLVTGIPKYNLASANHHGYLTDEDMKTIQYGLYALEVYVGLGISVVHKELFDPKRTAGMR